ncbi:MAG: DUF4236 domain-containing protein [Lachnospiraceae bacterium]|nr:DUF4236 domain-containing protein [Lachnospiraceae bacterium]
MGLNFRKSISLGKLVKLNLNKKSAGLSFGVKGARYSVNTSGQRRATIGIPGTGLSYTHTFGDKKKSAKTDRAKKKELEKNQEVVQDYNEQVDEIIGIHRVGADTIDWNRVETIPRKLAGLQTAVLEGNIDAYYEVIETVAPFDELVDFGSEFEIGTEDPKCIVAEFNIKEKDVIPDTMVTLTESGKVSEKKMTKTAYYEMLQDYVCSVMIRMARDLFALLPVERVIIHAVDDALNTATGNTEEVTYVSVIFDRATFGKINLDAIDPSDSLSNFEYNMKFGKTTGFKPVVKLSDW